MSTERETNQDQTPPQIDVWLCKECGYCRLTEDEDPRDFHPGPLVKARYIFLAEIPDA